MAKCLNDWNFSIFTMFLGNFSSKQRKRQKNNMKSKKINNFSSSSSFIPLINSASCSLTVYHSVDTFSLFLLALIRHHTTTRTSALATLVHFAFIFMLCSSFSQYRSLSIHLAMMRNIFRSPFSCAPISTHVDDEIACIESAELWIYEYVHGDVLSVV